MSFPFIEWRVLNGKIRANNPRIPDSLREKCPYSESYWSVFSGIRTEYGEIKKNSKYGHFLRSDYLLLKYLSNTDTAEQII